VAIAPTADVFDGNAAFNLTIGNVSLATIPSNSVAKRTFVPSGHAFYTKTRVEEHRVELQVRCGRSGGQPTSRFSVGATRVVGFVALTPPTP
jgi:hypothetical protein